jgi:hypothetical protein
MDSVLPIAQNSHRPHRTRRKPRTDALAAARKEITPPPRVESEHDATGPLATDDPFTWLPWHPQEGEEPEPSAPQEPQQPAPSQDRAREGTSLAA